MSIELKMPALSPTMEEGTLARWLVKPGDAIKPGDLLAEIETDKATMEIESIDEGVVQQILVAEGTDGIAVGTPIALIGEAGEMPDTPVEEPETAETPPPAKPEPLAPAEVEIAAVASRKASAPDTDKASPLAARVAEGKGLDLSTLRGSGTDGRVMLADLQLERPAPPHAAPSFVAPAIPLPADVPIETIKLSNMRKTIARRLTESKQQVPHIYMTIKVRLDALLALRSKLNQDLEARGIKLSVTDMIIRAQALALIACPDVNIQFAGDVVHRFGRADIAVAVAIDGGLITPIITSADLKSLSAISREMKELSALAREGKLQPKDYQGGTASLSNLGMFGIDQFDAVINPPQAMILAVGQGEERMIVVDKQPVIATMMHVTGSFDHRAIDGADAAAFMRSFKESIENPLALLA